MPAEVMNYGTPENQTPRDPDADGLKAVRARIAEYKLHDLDTEYLEGVETALVNRSKGKRRTERPDRSDSKNDDDLKKAAEAEAKKLAEAEEEAKKAAEEEAKKAEAEAAAKAENKLSTDTANENAVPQASTAPAKKVATPAKKAPAPAAPSSDKK